MPSELAANWNFGDTYAKAAAAGLLLSWIEDHELAFHPHDPGHISINYGSPQELVELMDSCPGLDQAWRELMAAKQLAYWVAQGLENNPAKAENGLVAIASAIGEKESHHDDAGLVSGDSLALLARIFAGEA